MGVYILIVFLVMAGGGMLIYVVKTLIDNVVFLLSAVRAEGKVVSFKTSYMKRTTARKSTKTMYKPVFEYRSGDGTVHRYYSSVASHPPAYQLGETETILFLKKNPFRAKINSFSEMWLFPVIFAFLGCALLAVAGQIFFNR